MRMLSRTLRTLSVAISLDFDARLWFKRFNPTIMKAFRTFTSIGTCTLLISSLGDQSFASINYTIAGATYSENFDSLPTDPPNNASLQGSGTGQYVNGWQDDTTTVAGNHISLPGWYLWHPLQPTGTEIGSNGHQRFREGNGQNTGSFWGFASAASASDKALGDIGSNTTAPDGGNLDMGLRLVNNTGLTLDTFTLTYDGEEWRDGQSASAETLLFSYSLSTSVADWTNNASYTSVAALNFTSPVFAGTSSSGTAVDGNSAGKVAGITATITGISWAPGTELWLRWSDPQLAGNADDGLAIDNLSFSAIQTPEPSCLSLLALAGIGWMIRRRNH